MGPITATSAIAKIPDVITSVASMGWPQIIAMILSLVIGIIGVIFLGKTRDDARHKEEQVNEIKDQASNAQQSSSLDQSAAKAENEIDNILK